MLNYQRVSIFKYCLHFQLPSIKSRYLLVLYTSVQMAGKTHKTLTFPSGGTKNNVIEGTRFLIKHIQLQEKYPCRESEHCHNEHDHHIYILVGGFKHFLFSISYMGCHPSH